MYKDEIISEVWENREAFSFKYSHNIRLMIKELMRRQKESGRVLVDRRKKTQSVNSVGRHT